MKMGREVSDSGVGCREAGRFAVGASSPCVNLTRDALRNHEVEHTVR
jgi:hypothetical protein